MGRKRCVFVKKKAWVLSHFEWMGHATVSKLKELLTKDCICAIKGDRLRDTDSIAFIITEKGQLAPVKYRAMKSAKARQPLLEKSQITDWLRRETQEDMVASQEADEEVTLQLTEGALAPQQLLVRG